MRIPEEGEKVKRLVEIAQERNIQYKPSLEANQELLSYVDRRGIPNPLSLDSCRNAQVPSMQPP